MVWGGGDAGVGAGGVGAVAGDVAAAGLGHFGGVVEGDGRGIFARGLEGEALAGGEGGAGFLELFVEGFDCLFVVSYEIVS